jgi:hypothetical protein
VRGGKARVVHEQASIATSGERLMRAGLLATVELLAAFVVQWFRGAKTKSKIAVPPDLSRLERVAARRGLDRQVGKIPRPWGT